MLTLILYNNEYIDINNADSSFVKTSFESVGKSARGIKSRAVFWDYLKANNLSTYKISNTLNNSKVIDDLICYTDTIRCDLVMVDSVILNLFIRTSDSSVSSFSERLFSSKLGNYNQYSEWNLSEISAPFKHMGFENYVNYFKENYKDRAQVDTIEIVRDFKILAGSLKEAKWSSLSKERIRVSDLKQEFLLIDFWYSSCYSCLKTIPELNKIDSLLGDKVEVLGFNSRDSNVVSIKNFVLNQSIKYDIVLKNIKYWEKLFEIAVFPTLILYNIKENKILFFKQGYEPGLFELVEKIVNN